MKKILAVLAINVALSGCSGTYLNHISAYGGIDHTNYESTYCVGSGSDQRSTSNLGFRLNIYESYDSRFKSNFKYSHHSCMFSDDAPTYDALGVELEYKFWVR